MLPCVMRALAVGLAGCSFVVQHLVRVALAFACVKTRQQLITLPHHLHGVDERTVVDLDEGGVGRGGVHLRESRKKARL